MTAPATTGLQANTREIELAIGGMTCAACAARVEKKLNKLTDVRASVNYATYLKRRLIAAGDGTARAELLRYAGTVEQAAPRSGPSG